MPSVSGQTASSTVKTMAGRPISTATQLSAGVRRTA